MRPLIVLRPQPVADATAQRARDLGLRPVVAPLFAPSPLVWEAPDVGRYEALFLSSAQALRLGGAELERLKTLSVFAVGKATADAAEASGFAISQIGDSDGQTLIGEMEDAGYSAILWLCGEWHSDIQPRRARLDPVPCYRMEAIDPPPDWQQVIGQPAIIMVHSTRAAQRLAEFIPTQRRHLSIVAISAKVAVKVGSGWGSVTVSDRPEDVAMLAASVLLCHKVK